MTTMTRSLSRPVIEALQAQRLSASTEAALHQSIGAALDVAGIEYQREARLSERDRIDFMAGPVGIEAKISGGRMSFARQLIRYAEHEEVEALVLVSSKAVSMPGLIGGVPLYVVSVGMGWL